VVTLADLSTVLQGGRLDENVNRVQLRQLGPTDAVCRHVNRRPVPERGRPEVEHEHWAQHLLQHTLEAATATARAQSAELVALTKTSSHQTEKLITLAQETSVQSDKLIDLTKTLVKLTKWIIGLTVVLGIVAILQLVAMFWPKGGA
jgi:hypothetical protein